MAPCCRELKKFVKNPWDYYPIVDIVPHIKVDGYDIKGLLDGGDLLVSKDQPLSGRFLTLLHELLHIEYPEWSERAVEAEARKLYYHLTERERLVLALVLETEEQNRHRFYFEYEEDRKDWQKKNNRRSKRG